VRRGEAVLLGTASVVFLAGCALAGLGLAETGTTQDIWTNVWFDFGMPLLVLAIAMGVHAVAMVHVRTLPPAANGGGPNGEIPGALRVAGAPAPGRLARVPVGCDARGRLGCETTTARSSRLVAQRLSERPAAD
jgi:hypothetical protein